jgi:protocatechuate 3,4-dioxygenase beta subunit
MSPTESTPGGRGDEHASGRADALTRRRLLGVVGGVGAAFVMAGCRRPPTKPPTTTSTGPGGACRLTPEQTEGPFYVKTDLVRSDITDGQAGTPLRLDLLVEDATCAALPDATVDIWHADAKGNYSDVGANAGKTTFMRGTQVSGPDGRVVFRTVYPGWYAGRATHIHVKVHTGGRVVHTGQLYFDEALNDAVYRTPLYSGRTGKRTTNAADGIYRVGGAQSMLAVTPDGDGYVGAITLVVA